MKRALGAVAVPLLALAAACGEESPVECASHYLPIAPTPSLEVTVVDSLSGQSLVPGARGRWIVGALSDSLYRVGATTLAGFGPPGRTALLVEASGYHPWARGDLLVRDDGCSVVTEEVLVRMRPLPPPPPATG